MMKKPNMILAEMWQNREESVEEFTAMLTSYGLLQRALHGSLSRSDAARYNSILVATVPDCRLRRQLCVR